MPFAVTKLGQRVYVWKRSETLDLNPVFVGRQDTQVPDGMTKQFGDDSLEDKPEGPIRFTWHEDTKHREAFVVWSSSNETEDRTFFLVGSVCHIHS